MALLRSNAQMEMGKDKSFLALAAAATMPPRAMCRAAGINSRRAKPSHRVDATVAAAITAAAAFYRGSQGIIYYCEVVLSGDLRKVNF